LRTLLFLKFCNQLFLFIFFARSKEDGFVRSLISPPLVACLCVARRQGGDQACSESVEEGRGCFQYFGFPGMVSSVEPHDLTLFPSPSAMLGRVTGGGMLPPRGSRVRVSCRSGSSCQKGWVEIVSPLPDRTNRPSRRMRYVASRVCGTISWHPLHGKTARFEHDSRSFPDRTTPG